MPLPSESAEISSQRTKIALAADVLRAGGSIRLKVQGSSMLPTLWPGDVLTIDRNCESLARGDVVMIRRHDRLFVHRLIEHTNKDEGQYWITRGDCMLQNDPPSRHTNVLGKVVRAERGKHIIDPQGQPSRLNRSIAAILRHSDLSRSMVLRFRSLLSRLSGREADSACVPGAFA